MQKRKIVVYGVLNFLLKYFNLHIFFVKLHMLYILFLSENATFLRRWLCYILRILSCKNRFYKFQVLFYFVANNNNNVPTKKGNRRLSKIVIIDHESNIWIKQKWIWLLAKFGGRWNCKFCWIAQCI